MYGTSMKGVRLHRGRLFTCAFILISLVLVCEHYWKKSLNEGNWMFWDSSLELKLKMNKEFKGVEYYQRFQFSRSNGSPWPPESIFALRDSSTGFYDMKIRPEVSPMSALSSDMEKYVEWLEQSARELRWRGSKLRKIVYLDRFLTKNSLKDNISLYPQVIDLPSTIRAVKSGMKVSVEPINDPDLFVIKSPSKVCNQHSPKQYELIVIMKSCAECFRFRSDVRNEFANLSYWSNFRISVLFVVGIPSLIRSYGYLRLRNSIWERIRHPFSSNIYLQHSQDFVFRKLFWESVTYEDVLIGSFIDSYYNLTLKQMFMFRWASTFCRNQSRLFLFMDHDQTLIPKNTIKFIRNIPDSQANYLIGGMGAQITTVIRNSVVQPTKWAMPYDVYPWSNYPPYPQGAVYLIGAKILEDIVIASAFTKRFLFEDVYLGIVAHRLNTRVVTFDEFWLNESYRINWTNAVTVRTHHMRRIYDWKLGKFKKSLSIE